LLLLGDLKANARARVESVRSVWQSARASRNSCEVRAAASRSWPFTGLRKVADEYSDRALIGEIHLPIERLITYYGAELSGIHLPFNFNIG
jgi:hypothetical protein